MDATRTMWTGLIARLGADHFTSSRRERRDADFLERVLASVKGDERVVDLGAGTGFLSLAIADKLTLGKVLAVDLSQEMLEVLLEKARERHREATVEIRRVEAGATGIPDASADLVVSIGLLHELPEPAAVTREAYRLLKPEGRVFIKDFRAGLIRSPLMRLIHSRGASGPLAPSALRALLAQAGFRQIEVSPEGSRHLVARGVK